jgi:hypothetical protein
MGEPPADRAARHFLGALHVVYAKPDAVVEPEIELADLPLQVRRADMLIGAVDAALKDREVVFAGIHGRAAEDVLADIVLHREMAGREIGPQAGVVGRFVRLNHRGLADLFAQDRLERRGVDFGNVERAGLLAINQRRDRLFLHVTALADFVGPAGASAQECLVTALAGRARP